MSNSLISVAEAKALVVAHCKSSAPQSIPLTNALYTVLAAPVVSPIDIPAFDQSAMDGYAVKFADLQNGKPLLLDGESYAGSSSQPTITAGYCARIFTGAPLPPGADTVVMQEMTRKERNKIYFDEPVPEQGINVRKQGAEVKQGALAMQERSLLTPAAIGYLAGLGLTEVTAYPFPSVHIINTGRELTAPGNALAFGKVYESNSFALRNALKQFHVNDVTISQVADDVEETVEAIKNAMDADIVLLTGGVSVGDYDFVVPALEKCDVETVFHKIRQRPGKPLFFGTKDNKMFFGLPGNPSSVLSCFYQYVTLAIQAMMKRVQPLLTTRLLPLQHNYSKTTKLTHFLKGHFDEHGVYYLGAQESFRLSSFAEANCLVEIPEHVAELEAGTTVKIHVIA